MGMVDLGIPPGFGLLREDLETMLEKTVGAKSGRLEKFQYDRNAGDPVLKATRFVRSGVESASA